MSSAQSLRYPGTASFLVESTGIQLGSALLRRYAHHFSVFVGYASI